MTDLPRPPAKPGAGEPRPAATLILCRHQPAFEVFWVRRAATTGFLPGYHAFPGGSIEPVDEEALAPGAVERGQPPEAHERAQAQRAALRETTEETGFVPLEGAAQRLVYLGVTTTPPYLGRGFRVHYFSLAIDADLAAGRAPAVPEGDPEHDAGAWIAPQAAVAAFEAGKVLLAPPTLALLRALAAEPLAEVPAAFGAERYHPPPNVSPIRPRLALFPVRTPTLLPATHTNCLVVGTDRLAVFDPASPYPEEQAALHAWLRRCEAEGARVERVVLTHHHRDHVGGALALAKAFNVPIVAHPGTAERVDFAVDQLIDEGDVVDLGDTLLDVLHTPGHAPGHLCFVDRATRSAIVGDMVAGLGTILIEPGDGDMIAYLAQLDRLRGLDLSCLIPSHGNVIGGAEAKLSFYIAHRLAREAKVLAALAEGAADLATLTGRAYADAPAMLRMGKDGGVAGMSLRAHLEKLLIEGRAADLGDGRFAELA